MKYRQLKKKLKNGYYLQFKRDVLYFDTKTYKFWLKGKKVRKRPRRQYICVCQGEYNSFICEVDEWFLYTNKEIIEYIKNSKKNKDKGKLVRD